MNLATALLKALLFALTAAPFILSPRPASAAEVPKRVLIFSSDDQFLPAVTIINQAIRTTIKNGSPGHVQFFYEAQDGFRIPNEKYEDELVRLLQRKYDGEHVDLIYVLAPPALQFLLKHRGELFSDIPVVYIVNDQRRVADFSLDTKVTGVGGKIELRPTLDIAMALQPETQKVFMVAGK